MVRSLSEQAPLRLRHLALRVRGERWGALAGRLPVLRSRYWLYATAIDCTRSTGMRAIFDRYHVFDNLKSRHLVKKGS